MHLWGEMNSISSYSTILTPSSQNPDFNYEKLMQLGIHLSLCLSTCLHHCTAWHTAVKALDSSWMCFLLQSHIVVAVRTSLSQRTIDLPQCSPIRRHYFRIQKKICSKEFRCCSKISISSGTEALPFLPYSAWWLSFLLSSPGQNMPTAVPSITIANNASGPRNGIFIQHFYYGWKHFPQAKQTALQFPKQVLAAMGWDAWP